IAIRPYFTLAVSQEYDSPTIIDISFQLCIYIDWALDRARMNGQKEFHDYDLMKSKRMRHVFYRLYEELADNQNWYLKRYLGMSNYLKRAYQLKEAYRYWFEESKTLGDNDLVGIKQ